MAEEFMRVTFKASGCTRRIPLWEYPVILEKISQVACEKPDEILARMKAGVEYEILGDTYFIRQPPLAFMKEEGYDDRGRKENLV